MRPRFVDGTRLLAVGAFGVVYGGCLLVWNLVHYHRGADAGVLVLAGWLWFLAVLAASAFESTLAANPILQRFGRVAFSVVGAWVLLVLWNAGAEWCYAYVFYNTPQLYASRGSTSMRRAGSTTIGTGTMTRAPDGT